MIYVTMTIVPISELEVKLITRELLVKAVLTLGIEHAWLMENHELKARLQENNDLALLINQYSDALWRCHFLLKAKKNSLTESDRERYSELISKKNHLRSQVMDRLMVPSQKGSRESRQGE